MKRYSALLLMAFTAALAFPGVLDAETHTVSWGAVTTYTDGTPIGSGTTVAYNFYWTSDPALSAGSLQAIASAVSQTSATFDPDQKGMPRGQTVYFTGEVVLGTGERSNLSPGYPWAVPVVVTPPTPPTLSSLSISGPSSLNEGSSGTFSATASWSDGSTSSVTPSWSENSSYASISSGGVLSASSVSSNQTVTVTASYSSGGVTRTATRSVTIVDVPAGTVSALQNIAITGPVATSPAKIYRLSWDPIETYADGAPMPAGTVRYTVYWTADPALSANSLTPLAEAVAETSVTFDPVAEGMAPNTRVYFTGFASAPNGAQSPLAGGISWVAANVGPAPPSGGVIIKR